MKSGKVGQVMSKYSIFFVLLVMILISMLLNENFLSTRNITNIAVQLSVATILAYGEMVLIVSGLLDLSSGAGRRAFGQCIQEHRKPGSGGSGFDWRCSGVQYD